MASSANVVANIAAITSNNILQVVDGATTIYPDIESTTTTTVERCPEHHNVPGALIRLLDSKDSLQSSQSLTTILGERPSVSLLTTFVPVLDRLLERSLVINIAVEQDHSVLAPLRSSGLVVLYSSTPKQAQLHALVAARLATQSSRAVLHFFTSDQQSEAVASIDQNKVKSFIETLSAKGNGVNGSEAHDELHSALTSAFADVSALTGQSVQPVTLHGNKSATDVAVVLGPGSSLLSAASPDLAVLEVNLVRPIPAAELLALVQPTATPRVAVLEQTAGRTTRLGPLFVDVAGAFQSGGENAAVARTPEVLLSGSLGVIADQDTAKKASQALVAALQGGQASHGFALGGAPASVVKANGSSASAPLPKVPKHEEAYNSMLEQVFGERLVVVNSPHDAADSHPSARSPEYAFGQVLAQLEAREQLSASVQSALREGGQDTETQKALADWAMAKDDPKRSTAASKALSSALTSSKSKSLDAVRSHAEHIAPKSHWIVGSDAWAYDAGMGGVHHVIASGRNVNMLIFDSVPYTARDAQDAHKRKKDVGLYAMNYGGTYVASTAVYADYTQVLHALMEADKFDGPSIVLAYVPYRTETAPALEVLRETKLAVDSGYWPLYRWDPSAELRGSDVFRLDGVRVREQLRTFLDRQNHLTLLANARPQLSYDLAVSEGTGLREAQKRKAKEAYEALLGNMDGPPLLILYASDGGNAEKVAKKLSARAKSRGLAARCLTMDDFPITDELKSEKNVVFLTSTAGQGEAPQNGRETIKTLAKLPASSFADSGLTYTVFGMGDSHYWPRAEDAHYYNKPAKDIDVKLEALGAERFAPLGLGDDQDADGYQTGYKPWEATLWKALGVDTVEVTEAEPEPITNEHIKIASNYLRGTILEGLADKSTGALAETDGQLTKFHGTYQQYDRDTLEERKAAGLEPAYSFMIRARIAGGVCTPEQWLQLDKVAGDYGNGTIKITTRQTIQYHCVLKSNLKAAMQGINKSLLDTIAACGDVNRNVMCSPNPALTQLHGETYEFAKMLSDKLLPRMDAYHEIWLDQETESKKKALLVGGALQDYEPLYGPYYLPRKFKIAIAVPPRNDVDCFAHDIGLIAIAEGTGSNAKLAGFNIAVGGGMGVTHSMKITYPRLGDVLGFLPHDQVLPVCREVMLLQRDSGNRANRKQARLKYTVDKVWGGAAGFKAELERRLGFELAPPRAYVFEKNTDEYGWKQDHLGNWHCTLWLENGRVRDAPGDEFRTGLRELAKIHKGKFRLTPNQHIIVADVKPEDKSSIEAHLRKWGMENWTHSGLKLSASACVSFPTCGLAMAESERYLPELVEKVEVMFEKNGLRHDEVTMRMTGCPNGCARPWVAEIAFVGKAPGSYLMLLGGGHAGERLNKIYRDNVSEPEILALLEPMIARYAQEREEGEHFGDWVIRAGIIAPTTSGAAFYDNVNTEGDFKAAQQVLKATA